MARHPAPRCCHADGLRGSLAAVARLLAGAAAVLAGPVLVPAARAFCHQPRLRSPSSGGRAIRGGPSPALAPQRRPPAWSTEGAARTPGAQRRTALAVLPRPGPFLLFEELKTRKPPKRTKRRRGKLWIRKNGEWKRVRPDVPPEQAGAETVPSDDPFKLAKQLESSGVALQLLAFLENAIPSPAFGAQHVALSMHKLLVQRCTLDAAALDALKDQQALHALAARGRELLLAEEAGQPSVELVAQALRSLAVYKAEMPQLHPLTAPLLALATRQLPEMSAKHVAYVVWAVAELREIEPDLQDRLLPLLVDRKRLKRTRLELAVRERELEDFALLERGLMKLRKEVPFLRQVLPE